MIYKFIIRVKSNFSLEINQNKLNILPKNNNQFFVSQKQNLARNEMSPYLYIYFNGKECSIMR